MAMNWWAILTAAAVGFGLGGVWYRLLAAPWMAAHGFTSETIRAHHGKGASKLPFVIAIGANLLIAIVMSGLLNHLGFHTVRSGMISGLFIWGGFILTTLAVNNTFAMRSPRLIAIDGSYWLLVMLATGGIIAGWPV